MADRGDGKSVAVGAVAAVRAVGYSSQCPASAKVFELNSYICFLGYITYNPFFLVGTYL